MAKASKKAIPVTKIRIRIPKGMSVREVVRKLEISFEEIDPAQVEGQFGSKHCCFDAAVVSPVSTVSDR